MNALTNKQRSSAAWRNMTTETTCRCGGPLRIVDVQETSATAYCTHCQHYSLCVTRLEVIHLADFHVKRGNAPVQRPFDDVSMAERLVHCLLRDVWPSPATVVDFGIASPEHLGALQHAVRSGCTAYDLDRVIGDGPAITQLVRSFGRQPYGPVEFVTAYDELAATPADDE